jgi:hypothetical protein
MNAFQTIAPGLLSQCVYNEDEKTAVHYSDVPDSLMLQPKYFIFTYRRG